MLEVLPLYPKSSYAGSPDAYGRAVFVLSASILFVGLTYSFFEVARRSNNCANALIAFVVPAIITAMIVSALLSFAATKMQESLINKKDLKKMNLCRINDEEESEQVLWELACKIQSPLNGIGETVEDTVYGISDSDRNTLKLSKTAFCVSGLVLFASSFPIFSSLLERFNKAEGVAPVLKFAFSIAVISVLFTSVAFVVSAAIFHYLKSSVNSDQNKNPEDPKTTVDDAGAQYIRKVLEKYWN